MDTVGSAPDAHLAAPADGFADLWGGGSGVRFDTSSVLPEEARGPLGYGDDPVAQLEAGGVPDFLAGAAGQPGVDPPALARVRGAVWAAFFRQGKEVLPGLAEAVRGASARLLTDLTAQDLYRLEETLTWLSGASGLTVDYETADLQPAAGSWQLTETGMQTVQTLLAGGRPAETTPETAR